MSKKLKGVTLDTLPYGGGYGDANKARLKHHTLLQEYQDLQKESNAMKNRLESGKQRKLTLLAEVRFLQKRHKYLSSMNSKNPKVRLAVPPVASETQSRFAAKGKISKKKDAMLRGIPPLPKSNQKGSVYGRKEASRGKAAVTLGLDYKQTLRVGKEVIQHNVSPHSDFNHRGRIYSEKEAATMNLTPVIDLNKSERIHSGNAAAVRYPGTELDLNQDGNLCRKEDSFPSRAPIFDLNEISTEEEDMQMSSAPLRLEELRRSFTLGGSEEQLNDLKLSMCRNGGEGPSRLGKRKISWQDPVALRV